jgi:putative flippase GtrA
MADQTKQQSREKRTLVDWFRDFIRFWPWAHEVFCKYEEILVYLVVGVLTTIVSWMACFLAEHFLLDASDTFQNFLINTIGWVVGVCFAYPLNRSWVFKSRNPQIAKEFVMFAVSRLSTWILDIAIMWLTVNLLSWNYWISKIFISSVVVTVLNYVFSKVLIFNKKK